MKSLTKILLYVLSVASVFSCTRNDIIPRKDMVKIYAEIFVVNEWLSSNQMYSAVYDTSFVYTPVLERYGYDNDDYMRSMNHYMSDPERYVKMLKQSRMMLDERLKEINALIEADDADRLRLQRLDSLKALVREQLPSFSLFTREDTLPKVFAADSVYRMLDSGIVRIDTTLHRLFESRSNSVLMPKDIPARDEQKPVQPFVKVHLIEGKSELI